MRNVAVFFFLLTITLGCSKEYTEQAIIKRSAIGSGSNFHLALTDAPNPDIKQVFVNIDRVEVRVSQADKVITLTGAQGLGLIDLLTLRNGVTLPLADFALTSNVEIQQIRFILKDSGNYLTNMDGSACLLKTPSQQQSGLKIIIPVKVSITEGKDYNLVVDFDALKSIVLQGNGGCLLKPVIKVKSLTTIALDSSVSTENGETVATAPVTIEENVTPPDPTPVPTPVAQATPDPNAPSPLDNDYNAEDLAALASQQ
ncbi:MAG: hypothetical protein A2X86_21475 [Bdellovibrionales bacterium GWA2_49_15]|nr:MAG: hypothetical protein A2X86_21475 [Bdellovibrionales bacterium GWA2_49_15]HAZ14951.1 hypothetical protein [Bdellovibrionales bacterium]